MNNMNDRNWLIRTTQFQILGPISKAKLIEFYQKGALSPNDEVTSGNGYWFAIREKDLVEKYLTGDMPQGFNPISESRTVLARRSSENTGTFSHNRSDHITQVININDVKAALNPKNEDLEYPSMPTQNLSANSTPNNDLKLPSNDDLEFPDVSAIVANVKKPIESQVNTTIIRADDRIKDAVKVKPGSPKVPDSQNSNEPVILPKDEDLDYPDMGEVIAKTEDSKKKERTSEKLLRKDVTGDFTFKVDEKQLEPQTQTVFSEEAEQFLDEIGFNEEKEEDKKPEKVEVKVKNSKDKSKPNHKISRTDGQVQQRNDNYLWIILIFLVLFIGFAFFYYYKEILNKPLPV